MPLKLDVKRKLSARSDRVKSVDLHSKEPWMLASLYNGNVHVWNHDTQSLVKSFEVTDLPVRAAKFVVRKSWIVAGSDDMMVRVFNYNTLEKVEMFEAHSDYIRSIVVHPTQSYILTSSDDMSIKLWDWEKKWSCSQVFEGHLHYVMMIVLNPKDNNTFASCSLDKTIKVWQLGSKDANFTLEGHDKGINAIDYFQGGDKPYLISAADDRLVKVWDYQNKTCVQTLEGHAQNVSCVVFHPELPIILSGSEDGTVRVWHSSTYRLETSLNYGMERVWALGHLRGSNDVAIGYDEGSVIVKLGREEPSMSMDTSGKIVWAKHSEIQQANLKILGDMDVKDGEKLPLSVKDMGSCEVFPHAVVHSPNGRFVAVCGDGEYIIYTAMALRNKSFGSAQEFVWSSESNDYAIREGSTKIKLFRNFKERKSFKPDFGTEAIFGGPLLCIKSSNSIAFHEWEGLELIRRIEINPRAVVWNDGGELVCIAGDEGYFILKYQADEVAKCLAANEGIDVDGIETAFDVVGEVDEVVKTGKWVGDCFIYTNSVNRLNYYVGGEIVTISHLDRVMYLLGYIPGDNRLYLGDKELSIVSYALQLSVLEYQTAVMRKDFDTADHVLPTIPREMRTRVAHFLEKQGYKAQALTVSTDPEHKFELAIKLKDLKVAHQLAQQIDADAKWKQLSSLAIAKCEFGLAQECMLRAQDYSSLLLLATSSGNAGMLEQLAQMTAEKGQNNIAFLSYFLLGRLEDCLELLCKTGRLAEAAFVARTYLPSHLSRIIGLWRADLAKTNEKAAESIADPQEYENLFPDLSQALQAEEMLAQERAILKPAALYPNTQSTVERNVMEELSLFLSQSSVHQSVPSEVPEFTHPAVETADPATPPKLLTTDSPPVAGKNDKDELDLNFDDDEDFQLDSAGADNIDLDDPNDFSDDEDLLGD